MASRIAAAQAALASVQASQDAEYAKKNQARRERAVQWADKEIRKLIAVLIKLGRNVTFIKLFGATVDDFEAISGTLVAAKKRDVIAYDGPVLLMQGSHDSVVIKLLKDTIPDSPLPPPEAERKAPVPKSHTKGLEGAASAGPEKCATCGKTVYMTERLGIAGKVYHSEGCFKCNQCNLVLRQDNFCSVNGKIWCQPHYNVMSMSLKGFVSETKAGLTAPATTSTPSSAAPVAATSLAAAVSAAAPVNNAAEDAAEAKRQQDAATVAAAEEKKRFEAEKAKREADRLRERQAEEAAATQRAATEAAERKRRDDERKRAEEVERAKERAAEEAAKVAAQQAANEAERKRRADAETARKVAAEKERVAREVARKAEEEKLEVARRAREAEEKKKRDAKEKVERDEEARLAKEEVARLAAIQQAAAVKKAPAKLPPPVAAGSTASNNSSLLAQGQAMVAVLQQHPSHPSNAGAVTAAPAPAAPGRAAPTRPAAAAAVSGAPATAASVIVKVPIKAGRTIGVVQAMALHLITYLDEFGLYETGLFRDCYAPAEVSALNGLVDKYFVGATAGKSLPVLEKYTMSTVAISLMQLLQSSEGIFPSNQYSTLCQLQATQRGIGKMVVLSEMINELPTASFNFILPFLELLYHVHKNHEITQMTATDLAPLFLFAFIRPPAGATADNERRMTQLFIDILENYEQLEETTTLNDINEAMDEFLGDFPEFAPQPELVVVKGGAGAPAKTGAMAKSTTKMYNPNAMY